MSDTSPTPRRSARIKASESSPDPKRKAESKKAPEKVDDKIKRVKISNLTVGSAAPDFNLVNQDGENVSLSGLAGKFVILYVYPKDNTPGCTAEGQCFNTLYSEFQALNANVFGISADSATSHQKFIAKYSFQFPLLSDPKKEFISAYGAKKSGAGSGIQRSTFLIDPEGKVAHIWNPVKGAKDHPKEVLEKLKAIAVSA